MEGRWGEDGKKDRKPYCCSVVKFGYEKACDKIIHGSSKSKKRFIST